MQIVFWITVIILAFGISEIACIDCEELAKKSNSKIDKQTLTYIYSAIKIIALVILTLGAVIGLRIGV